MIVKLKLVDQMRAGSKTQHRLPVNGHTTDREYGVCKVKPGRSYPIQTVAVVTEDDGYGNERQVRIVAEHGLMIVASVWRQSVDAISVEEAKTEGFSRKGFGDREAFFAHWEEAHGPVRGDAWVVEFEADMHAPRYLRAGSGYTLNVAQAIDPLPVVPAEDQRRFTAEAETHDHLRAEQRLEAYEIGQRYEAAKAEAERLGLDIRHHERAIKERLQRIERGIAQRQGRAA